MIKFFKVNEPTRIAALFLLMLALRLPVLIEGIPLMVPEIKWLTIGEKLADGGMLYRDLWDNIAPLAAIFYALYVKVFAKSLLPIHILALILTFTQALFFNYLASKHEVFGNKHYLAGLFYIISSSLFIDFFTLSPVLLSMTFILLALNDIISQLYKTQPDSRVFNIGLYIAIAALCYFPAIVLIIWVVSVMLIFTRTSVREIMVIMIGFLFPFLIVLMYYLWVQLPGAFFEYYFWQNLYQVDVNYIETRDLAVMVAFPVFMMFLGYLRLITVSQTHFQSVTKFSMALYALFAVLMIWFTHERSSFSLIVFLPALVFFASHYFGLLKRKWMINVFFWSYFGACLYFSIGDLYFWTNSVTYQNLKVKKYDLPIENKHLLIIGDEVGLYKNNTLATSYINWPIASYDFGHLDSYKHIANITAQFNKDMPEVIIDQEGIMPLLQQKIPLLKHSYKAVDQSSVYFLVKKL